MFLSMASGFLGSLMFGCLNAASQFCGDAEFDVYEYWLLKFL